MVVQVQPPKKKKEEEEVPGPGIQVTTSEGESVGGRQDWEQQQETAAALASGTFSGATDLVAGDTEFYEKQLQGLASAQERKVWMGQEQAKLKKEAGAEMAKFRHGQARSGLLGRGGGAPPPGFEASFAQGYADIATKAEEMRQTAIFEGAKITEAFLGQKMAAMEFDTATADSFTSLYRAIWADLEEAGEINDEEDYADLGNAMTLAFDEYNKALAEGLDPTTAYGRALTVLAGLGYMVAAD